MTQRDLNDRCVSVQVGALLSEAIASVECIDGSNDWRLEIAHDLLAVADLICREISDTAPIVEAMDSAEKLIVKILAEDGGE